MSKKEKKGSSYVELSFTFPEGSRDILVTVCDEHGAIFTSSRELVYRWLTVMNYTYVTCSSAVWFKSQERKNTAWDALSLKLKRLITLISRLSSSANTAA